MRFLVFSMAALASAATSVFAEEVKVEVTRAVECERKTQKGDKISVHYRGSLWVDGAKGKQFDASYDRGSPLSFQVGKGSVIKGLVLRDA
jgi:FK506-binding protein 2